MNIVELIGLELQRNMTRDEPVNLSIEVSPKTYNDIHRIIGSAPDINHNFIQSFSKGSAGKLFNADLIVTDRINDGSYKVNGLVTRKGLK